MAAPLGWGLFGSRPAGCVLVAADLRVEDVAASHKAASSPWLLGIPRSGSGWRGRRSIALLPWWVW